METQEVLEIDRDFSPNVNGLEGDGFELVGYGENASEDLGDELLVNLETYLDDINDRLLISRMVNDSVIKGMVNAVEQEAAEKIAAKDLEVANLKEFLQHCNVGFDRIDPSRSSIDQNEQESGDSRRHTRFDEAWLKHDEMMEWLRALRNLAREQLKKLKKGFDSARGCSIRRICSDAELVGLGGILHAEESESWIPVDRTLDNLKITVDNICSQANAMVRLSKSSLCDWYWERELQKELETMVMQSSIQSCQEEFEQKLWDQSAQSTDSLTVNWIEKFHQISNLRMELDAILKSLPSAEMSLLISHGSHDADLFHRKVLSNHDTCLTSHWDGNGKLDASSADVPENFEAAQLKHMSKEELVGYFNTMITKMRRNHESIVQQLTEEYFSLKREYLKERGSSLTNKKDKEFDMLRKKIRKVVLKLDGILIESQKLPAFTSDANNYSNLKGRLDNLVLENRQLRDSLRDKEKELKCLTSQLSDASGKLVQHSLAEDNMLKIIGRLHTGLDDAHIEAALSQDLYKLFLDELIQDIRYLTEDSAMAILKKQEIYDIIYHGAVANTETKRRCEIEDSDVESWIVQGLCEVTSKEALKDACQEIDVLYGEYLSEKEKRTLSEMKALEKEKGLRLEAEHNGRLKQEIATIAKSIEEKEKVARDVSAALRKEREQFELASQELCSLREDANQQRMLVSESSKELDIVKVQLSKALEQIEADRVEIQKLDQKLEQAHRDLEQTDGQRKMILDLSQENHNKQQLIESKEKEFLKQVEAVVASVQGLSNSLADFESKIAGKIKSNNLRLEDSFSLLKSLLKKAKLLRSAGFLYKQKLERRCVDLQMAEDEVDLLGDEVDTLLNLLEKIYMALDHYSPVLQHYPGIIEILKLVRRELSGESTKPA